MQVFSIFANKLNKTMSITILGIESSCDDTSASVCKDGKILSNLIANQEIHKAYGGVVPELASRDHEKNIVPVVDQAMKQAGVTKEELSAIAFTLGPGLLGSLLVGSCFGKSLALSLGIPIITVHHMKAHVMAHFIDEPMPPFPFLCLTVSGGHTQIVLIEDYLKMSVIGSTIDDAAGEAFDKTAKMLGLEYPGGPLLDKLAKTGDPKAFTFAKPNVGDLNYSFSGLKTSVLYFLQKQEEGFIEKNLNDLCASIQYTIIKILFKKLIKASKETGINHIAIAGGVSANSGLRAELQNKARTMGWTVYIPKFEYCTDNAAMIAITGYHQYLAKDFAEQDVSPKARFEM